MKMRLGAVFMLVIILIFGSATLSGVLEKVAPLFYQKRKIQLELQSHCFTPQQFQLKLVEDNQVDFAFSKVPSLPKTFRKISSAFAFGVDTKCPDSSPIVLTLLMPKIDIHSGLKTMIEYIKEETKKENIR